MFEVVCTTCREVISGENEEFALNNYQWHCIIRHDEEPPEEEVA